MTTGRLIGGNLSIRVSMCGIGWVQFHVLTLRKDRGMRCWSMKGRLIRYWWSGIRRRGSIRWLMLWTWLKNFRGWRKVATKGLPNWRCSRISYLNSSNNINDFFLKLYFSYAIDLFSVKLKTNWNDNKSYTIIDPSTKSFGGEEFNFVNFMPTSFRDALIRLDF